VLRVYESAWFFWQGSRASAGQSPHNVVGRAAQIYDALRSLLQSSMNTVVSPRLLSIYLAVAIVVLALKNLAFRMLEKTLIFSSSSRAWRGSAVFLIYAHQPILYSLISHSICAHPCRRSYFPIIHTLD